MMNLLPAFVAGKRFSVIRPSALMALPIDLYIFAISTS
jgi:hypothetical protein